VKSALAGTVRRVATRELGLLSIEIGCGRARKDDVVDPASGFRVLKKTGDAVATGEPLLVVELGPRTSLPEGYLERVAACFEVGTASGAEAPLPFVVEKL
jgi:pyrimidine-nucleoside phosphorylase